MQQQMTIEDLYPATWCGKTYPEPYQATVEKTSEPSLKKRQGSPSRMPLFLDLTASGATAEQSWEMGGALLGEYTTRSFGESPKEGVESRLSQILQDDPLPKYCLSEKACQGILNRASRRGKELPKELKEALEAQATPSRLGGGCEVDSHGRGAGKGPLIQEEKSATLGVSQDQTLFQDVAVDLYNQSVTGDVAATVTAACGGANTSGGKVLSLNAWDVQSKHIASREGVSEPIYSGECRYGGGESYVFDTGAKDEER